MSVATAARRFPWEGRESIGNAWREATWAAERDSFIGMQRAAARCGARFAMLAVPIAPQLDASRLAADRDYTLYPQARLRAICSAAAIPFLDLHASMLGRPASTLFRDEIHLTAEGHRVVALALIRFLEGRHLLPGR